MNHCDARRRADEGTTFDHLHSPATELAGIASKAAVGTASPSPRGGLRTRRSSTRKLARRNRVTRWAVLPVVALAMLGAGSAAFSRETTNGDPMAGNSVHAYGGAPVLGPDGAVDFSAGVLDIAAAPAADGYWLVAADGGVFAYGDAPFLGSTGGMPLNAPVVGLAPTPSGNGYWLVATDGGVFSYGDATFLGSLGSMQTSAPVLAMAATPSGQGYWLVTTEGGVFAFGDAVFAGSATTLDLPSAIVGIAPTTTGEGYWLLAADGGVFAYGDAQFLGANVNPASTAISIAADPNGAGYWVLRTDGTVDAFGVAPAADAAPMPAGAAPAVGIAARPAGGYWVAQGVPPQAPGSPVALSAAAPDIHAHPFLVCTRAHESSHTPPLYDDGYAAVNPSGTYRGAYQFSRSTWDNTARHAGRPDLVGVDPAAASVADQDFLALDLYQWRGAAPWLGRCAGK